MRRIGQILSESIPLTSHDIAEILEEQKVTRQRFGEAAIALGLAQPQQVWQAWVDQLRTSPEPIDLNTIPADPHAVGALSARLAHDHNAFPIRCRGNEMIIAVQAPLSEDAVLQLHDHCRMQLIFIRAAAGSLAAAIKLHYPSKVSEAA